jgi:hypothetical protein
MDLMDQYLSRLLDPAVRSFNRRLHGINEGDPDPDPSVVTDQHISASEKALGVALPRSYGKLVTTVQPSDAEYGLYWVQGDELNLFGADIVSVNRGPNSALPPFLVAVQGVDNGDEYCFDTRHPDERGEYPIVHFNHEIHNEDSTEFERASDDLGGFLFGSLGGESSA